MPRKYTPEVEVEWGTGWYDGEKYHYPRMRESKDGEWVKLQTFLDETSRLRQTIKRLVRELNKLKENQL